MTNNYTPEREAVMKRYDLHTYACKAELKESDSGMWVKWDDVKCALEELIDNVCICCEEEVEAVIDREIKS